MADIKEGLYITEMIGMGVNGVTGDYSRGAAGYMIRDGALAEPVAEVTVAGNLLEMFASHGCRLGPGVPARHRFADGADRRDDDGGRLRLGGLRSRSWRRRLQVAGCAGRPGRIARPAPSPPIALFFADQHVQIHSLSHGLIAGIVRVQMITAIVSGVDMLWVVGILDHFIKVD